MGQKWAKFLNPNQSAAASANQKPSEELKLPKNPHDGSQPSLNFSPGGGVNQQYVFRGTEGSPFSKSSMAQISPDDFLPVEGKVQQSVHREADQSEPMDHGHTPSYVQSPDSRMGQQLRPSSFPQVRYQSQHITNLFSIIRRPKCGSIFPVTDFYYGIISKNTHKCFPKLCFHSIICFPSSSFQSNSLKSRVHLNRKRQHQSSERSDGRISDEKEMDRGQDNRTPWIIRSFRLYFKSGVACCC